MYSHGTHIQQGLWCSGLTRQGIFSSPLEADDNWKTKSHTQPWHSTHAHEGVWYSSFKEQCIVSSPLEADHWNKCHLPELHCFSMWSTTKSMTSVSGAITKTLLVPANRYGPQSEICMCHVPFSCIASASMLAWSGANASVLVPIQSPKQICKRVH